jgi:hypothetical protein
MHLHRKAWPRAQQANPRNLGRCLASFPDAGFYIQLARAFRYGVSVSSDEPFYSGISSVGS